MDRLTVYAHLLEERNRQLNLVAPSTIADMWRRHFWDSAQLVPLIQDDAKTVVDIGSGAGFPGLVIAILLSGRPGFEVHLIEATQKKCRFLEEVAAATAAPATVHWARAEDVPGPKADVVTARAVAPLTKLLGLAFPFFKEGTVGLFPKGQNANAELTDAGESWKLTVERVPSRSDPRSEAPGTIFRVTGLSPWRKPRKPS